MASTAEIRTIESCPSAVVRREVALVDLGQALVAAVKAVRAHVEANGVDVVGQPFAVYSDYGPDSVTIEAGLPVASPIEPSGDILPSELPGGEVGFAVHRGPMDTIHDTLTGLCDWLAGQGHTPADFHWEVYTAEPGVTEVHQPLT